MNAKERNEYIQTLRDRFLSGTLDEVLIPDDPPVDRLLDAIFSTRLPYQEGTKEKKSPTEAIGRASITG